MAKIYTYPNMKIKGDKEVLESLDRLAKKSEDLARQVLAKTTLEVIKIAKTRVNVDTSRLEQSITGAMANMKELDGIAVFRGEVVTRLPIPNDKMESIVGTDVHYAIHQEFGKRGRPYLRPALKRGMDFMKESIRLAYEHLAKKGV